METAIQTAAGALVPLEVLTGAVGDLLEEFHGAMMMEVELTAERRLTPYIETHIEQMAALVFGELREETARLRARIVALEQACPAPRCPCCAPNANDPPGAVAELSA